VLAPDIDYERIVQILRQFLVLFNIKFWDKIINI
jgi:hypothetical protein